VSTPIDVSLCTRTQPPAGVTNYSAATVRPALRSAALRRHASWFSAVTTLNLSPRRAIAVKARLGKWRGVLRISLDPWGSTSMPPLRKTALSNNPKSSSTLLVGSRLCTKPPQTALGSLDQELESRLSRAIRIGSADPDNPARHRLLVTNPGDEELDRLAWRQGYLGNNFYPRG
jgi:hypothetical protein